MSILMLWKVAITIAVIGALSPSDATDCLQDFLLSAGVQPEMVPLYAAQLRANRYSVGDLRGANLSVIIGRIELPLSGIDVSQDAINIRDCLAIEDSCLENPFCRGGGSCVYIAQTASHACRCPSGFGGVRCNETTSGQLAVIEETIRQLQEVVDTIGVTYTRWGKKTCGPSELIYSGYMAGGPERHTGSGSGSNYVCLPPNPVFADFTEFPNYRGLLFPVELETRENFEPFASATDHDLTCAVCRAPRRSSHLVVPARNVCPPSWTLEYHGYLMTSFHHYALSTEYVCVDGQPDVVPNSGQDLEGSEIVFTEVPCDRDLPCPPYDDSKELTCAVCTR